MNNFKPGDTVKTGQVISFKDLAIQWQVNEIKLGVEQNDKTRNDRFVTLVSLECIADDDPTSIGNKMFVSVDELTDWGHNSIHPMTIGPIGPMELAVVCAREAKEALQTAQA